MSKGPTCRCSMCGVNNAGKPGGRSFGGLLVGRDESNYAFDARTRREERRLRRTREKQAWRKEVY